jgi:hypothetical protein
MTKKIPDAVYPCLHCSDTYSWPPEDLSWSEIEQGWVCGECWDDRDVENEESGGSLADELRGLS